MNRLKGTCLRERIEICTYRVTWMQGSWTVSLYRIIHTNAFIWISKHWNSIALLYTSRLVSLSVFCFVLTPPKSICRARGEVFGWSPLVSCIFATDPAAQEGILEGVSLEQRSFIHTGVHISILLRRLLAFTTSVLCIFCSS